MHLIPWRVIFFFIIPSILILWKVLPWARAKGLGFITKTCINTVILWSCMLVAPFSLVYVDKLIIWSLGDSTAPGDADKVAYITNQMPRDMDYAQRITDANYLLLLQVAVVVGIVLTLIYTAHLALKKRGKSWTNL